jgi:hypothetical protein
MLPKLESAPYLMGATIGAAILSTGIVGVPLQALAAIVLVAILPGIVVLRLLDPESLADARGLAFVPALSFAVVIGCGIVLHSLGAMHYWGWAISLSAFTLGALAWGGAVVTLDDDRQVAPIDGTSLAAFDRSSMVKFAAALGLVVATLGVTTYRAATHREFYVTEFWMAPDLNARSDFILGVRNLTSGPQTYVVELAVSGQPHSKWADVHVLPGQTWTTSFQAAESLGNDRARADLFLKNEPNRLLRSVWLAPRQAQDAGTIISGPAARPKP